MPARVLVVDDDPRLREVVRYALARQGHEVLEASDGRVALDIVARDAVDLVVLDVLMPELDGLETCRRLRATSRVPVIFLSSRGEELDRVLGLELGGDDYLTKPFSTRELVSRVKAVLRRTRSEPDETGEAVLAAGTIRLDTERHRCWIGASEVVLTVTEFRILQTLMRHPGRVYTRAELVDQAYPEVRYVSDRTVDSHVRRIRAKLREHGLEPIDTIHGLGFRLDLP